MTGASLPARRRGAPTLLLFPTELELERFGDLGGLPRGLALTAVCGFGPIAAAARTAQLCGAFAPARVVLAGIAGTYDPGRHPIGEAAVFGRVALDGVGVGQGPKHLAPPALGFPQWPGSPDTGERIDQTLDLARPDGATGAGPLLVTTCAASADREEAADRVRRFPGAAGEDMEAFGVALACALARAPLTVVRGFSNEVGDRATENWRLPAAISAARRLTLEVLGAEEAAG